MVEYPPVLMREESQNSVPHSIPSFLRVPNVSKGAPIQALLPSPINETRNTTLEATGRPAGIGTLIRVLPEGRVVTLIKETSTALVSAI